MNDWFHSMEDKLEAEIKKLPTKKPEAAKPATPAKPVAPAK